jgi:hypothetical protein
VSAPEWIERDDTFVLAKSHACQRYRERHPLAGDIDVERAWRDGRELSRELVAAVTQSKRRLEGNSEYRLSPCGGLILCGVRAPFRHPHYAWHVTIATALRLSEHQQDVLRRPVVAPPTEAEVGGAVSSQDVRRDAASVGAALAPLVVRTADGWAPVRGVRVLGDAVQLLVGDEP